jgi:DNA replication protein DnaC
MINPSFPRSSTAPYVKQILHDGVRRPAFRPDPQISETFELWLQKCKHGIYIHGLPGNGKTTSLLWLYHHMVDLGLDVQYTSARDLVDSARTCIGEGRNIQEMLNRFVDAGCLILDDIGAERMTEFTFFDVIFPLLSHRLDRDPVLPTVIASNLNFQGIINRYSRCDGDEASRFLSRIEGKCTEIILGKETYRVPVGSMLIK